MLVIAKTRGEFPQGRWRNPGEKFEFDAKDKEGKQQKPALWMATAKDVDEARAKDKAKADEALEIIQAKADVEAKIKAKHKAKTDGAKAEEPTKENEADKPKEFRSEHKGGGKHNVLDADGKIVDGGEKLNKADAAALVKQLLAKKAEA